MDAAAASVDPPVAPPLELQAARPNIARMPTVATVARSAGREMVLVVAEVLGPL
jgi:hypothetical protein